jgi:2-phospho-L-lactate guanylyltransferase
VSVLCCIPVKPFEAAKQRLAAVMQPATRRRLSRALAAHTLEVAARSGAVPLILAADHEVATWARSEEVEALLDLGSPLNVAAAGGVALAGRRGMPWMICHADLPLLEEADLEPMVTAVALGQDVIAPSTDGGTTVLGSERRDIEFAYGPVSFHRHLPQLRSPLIRVAAGTSIDLDEPADLVAALNHPRGRWLRLDSLPPA